MLFKSATLCDYATNTQGDIRITDGVITEIAPNLAPQKGEEILDCSGLVLLPSLIDLNVSLSDKSLNTKNLLSLIESAHRGGVGSVALLPDCQPRIDSEETIEFIHSMCTLHKINLFPIASAIRSDGNLSELSILNKKGCKAIFVDSHLDGNLMRRACEYALFLQIPLFCRCDDPTLRGNGAMNDSYLSAEMGLPAIPSLSEVKEVAKMSEVAVFMGNTLRFCALSSERSLTIIDRCREENPNIFSECSIHHLVLTEELCKDYNTAAKILPPLKGDETRQKLLQSLQKGRIHTLTSLHSPSTITRKDLAFEEAAFGIDALHDYFSLLYTFLVKPKILTLSEVSRYCSRHPAQILNIHKGILAVGADADIILVDTNATTSPKGALSPYSGQQLFGEVAASFVGGICCYKRETSIKRL